MYRIIYNGSDEDAFSYLQNGLPDTMELIFTPDKNKLHEILRTHSPHAVVLPFTDPLPIPEDLAHLQMLVALPRVPGVIVIARNLTVSQAVCIMRNGAYDCFSGPIPGNVLGLVVNRLISETNPTHSSNDLIFGQSQVITALREKLHRYANLDYRVLITGETGSGKELAAKTLHLNSSRKNGPFVPVNCASYPDDLLETELFGSSRGAFTGSIDRVGLFESAHGGVIFLDEIGELSLSGQAKLLRVIEEKAMRRMGSNRLHRIDARIIAATNQDLKKLTAAGHFRSDLFYRLNLLEVKTPPLREHREDIPLLVRSYLGKIPGVSRQIDCTAMRILVEHHWPGNVRELQSVVLKSALNAGEKTVRGDDIQFD